MTTAPRVVGMPEARVDGRHKVTGSANYGADFDLPGTLWAKTVRSHYPHARIAVSGPYLGHCRSTTGGPFLIWARGWGATRCGRGPYAEDRREGRRGSTS